MTIKIKPGLLVSLSVRSRGGVTYQKKDLLRTVEEATEVKAWETTRIIADTEEHERATKVRGAARSTIAKVCTHSAFGLLCPEADESNLDAAIAAARKLAEEFNATAKHTQLGVYVLKGRVAATDAEAAAAIADEVKGLLAEMERACKAADVEAIREAASRAKGLGEVLDGPAAYTVGEAVKAARAVARAVVKRVEKEGESAEQVLRTISLAPIEVARFMFEDDTPATTVEGTELPAVDVRRFTDDMGGDPEPTVDEPSTGEVKVAAIDTQPMMEV
jgi:hypothetical protein